MSEVTPALAADVVAACQAGAAEAGEALSRALDGTLTVAVGEAGSFDAVAPPAGFDGPGLAMLLTFGGVGVLAVLPETTGLVPAWCAAPDPTGESKLSTLAQELSMLLVPESLMADAFEARRVANVSAAVARAGVAADAALVPLTLSAPVSAGQLSLIWPLATPASLFDAPEATTAAPVPPTTWAEPAGAATSSSAPMPTALRARSLTELPGYSRSLLQIRTPVSVLLAAKKETVGRIVEIVPGSIIKFDKGCDELLHMTIGGQAIAQGEAVKIGEKFGFRVVSMILPEEHFLPMRKNRSA